MCNLWCVCRVHSCCFLLTSKEASSFYWSCICLVSLVSQPALSLRNGVLSFACSSGGTDHACLEAGVEALQKESGMKASTEDYSNISDGTSRQLSCGGTLLKTFVPLQSSGHCALVRGRAWHMSVPAEPRSTLLKLVVFFNRDNLQDFGVAQDMNTQSWSSTGFTLDCATSMLSKAYSEVMCSWDCQQLLLGTSSSEEAGALPVTKALPLWTPYNDYQRNHKRALQEVPGDVAHIEMPHNCPVHQTDSARVDVSSRGSCKRRRLMSEERVDHLLRTRRSSRASHKRNSGVDWTLDQVQLFRVTYILHK